MATSKKHRRRGKFNYEDIWSFKKSFKRDYIERKEFNKNKYKIIRYGTII